MKGVLKMEIAIALLIGLLVGTGGTVIGFNLAKKEDTKDETGIEQQKVVQQLTNLDITKPICEPEYIKKAVRPGMCIGWERLPRAKSPPCFKPSSRKNEKSHIIGRSNDVP